jgi:type VI protein secretion system component VasF
MVELHQPGRFADELELELVRYRRAAALVAMPPALGDLAEALERVAAMLREADARGQAVDLSDDIVRLIRRFRGALAALGGAPAEA